MADIMTPALGESVTEATVARWTKKPGEAVKKDEILVELETDKVSLEVASPSDGVLSEIAAADGETVMPGALLGRVSEGAAAAAPSAPPQPQDKPKEPPATATDVAPAGEAQPGARAHDRLDVGKAEQLGRRSVRPDHAVEIDSEDGQRVAGREAHPHFVHYDDVDKGIGA